MGQGSAAVPEEHGRQARTQLAGAGTALPGQMLHAVELGLHHPLTQEPIVCSAELPPCFGNCIPKWTGC